MNSLCRSPSDLLDNGGVFAPFVISDLMCAVSFIANEVARPE
jgi:hypothetical protein